MLAASISSSNVPPDHLQPAPLGASAVVPRKKLAKHHAAMVSQANPADFSEQQPAGFPARRVPCPIRSQDGDFPVRVEAQRTAISPSAPQLTVFPDRCRSPQDTASQPHPQVCWQLKDNQYTREAQQHAGPGNEPAQAWIRLKFGGVFG